MQQRQQGHTRKALSPPLLSLLAVVVGVVGGLGAVAFRCLIALFHNLLFLGKLSTVYEANVHTVPSPWGAFIILAPVAGAVGVAFLVGNFAPEAKGHGVPEVMDSIYYGRGIIRPVVAVVKSFASALSIGSGGSVGREGPIIQIGSSFGSSLGQIISMPAWQRITLIAAGTGAGIAATFNTPIGGMLFAAEIILHEVSVRTLVPVAIATATATSIGQLFFGTSPAFMIPALATVPPHFANPIELLSYVGLGPIIGLAAAGYIRSIYAFEDFFEQHVSRSYYTRHVLGMLMVGILMYLMMRFYGHYYIQGVGYATIEDVLTGTLRQVHLLLLLFGLKMLVTSITLGSGASGGIFSPALFLGATLGGGYGLVLTGLFPALHPDPAAFAIAGMAGMVGGATGAALAAIVMIFEMTLDYYVILPITITVALSNGMRWLLSKETIYTLKLSRRGHHMPKALQTNFLYLRRAKDIMNDQFVVLSAATTLEGLRSVISREQDAQHLLLENDGRIGGVVTREAALAAIAASPPATRTGEIAATRYVTVNLDTTFFEIVNQMRTELASSTLVLSSDQADRADDVRGLITEQEIVAALGESLDLFAE